MRLMTGLILLLPLAATHAEEPAPKDYAEFKQRKNYSEFILPADEMDGPALTPALTTDPAVGRRAPAVGASARMEAVPDEMDGPRLAPAMTLGAGDAPRPRTIRSSADYAALVYPASDKENAVRLLVFRSGKEAALARTAHAALNHGSGRIDVWFGTLSELLEHTPEKVRETKKRELVEAWGGKRLLLIDYPAKPKS